eukprot:CAMPEP_0185175110 /NCGR_PEP_ID=MMETSP1139-20130426/26247_1 /TAXON_ID=298111 /ORGANISM="Pavlova sp., Strain CCMP459" /LENGTH=101 /DNA_ID=CAMNT_0027740841 /DNA_START=33 /DNA_END=338 /DNA_ORIENTATION=-
MDTYSVSGKEREAKVLTIEELLPHPLVAEAKRTHALGDSPFAKEHSETIGSNHPGDGLRMSTVPLQRVEMMLTRSTGDATIESGKVSCSERLRMLLVSGTS